MTAREISDLLLARGESFARFMLPNGERQGNEWRAGSVGGEAGESLHVTLEGSKAGMWCDFGGGPDDKGDFIGLWMAVRGVPLTTACKEALDWLEVPEDQRNGHRESAPRVVKPKVPDQRWIDLQATMRAGSDEELTALADLRDLPSLDGMRAATEAGILFFGDVYDGGERHPAWILTDGSRKNAQARKLDGSLWMFDGKRKPAKSKTIWGTDPKWPVGLHGSDTDLMLVEGGPDLLAAWHIIVSTGRKGLLTPIGMFGVSNEISDEALPLLARKLVWMFPHNDDNEAGAKGAAKWTEQLGSVGAVVRTHDFRPDGVKDLNELVAKPGAALPRLKAPVEIIEDEEAPAPPTKPARRPLFDFALAKDGDHSILLGDRYLNRGDGAVISSTSGMGKSALTIQMAVELALNRGPFGIQGNGPLRSLIIQSEDSDGDVAEVAYSMRHVLGLSDADVATVNTSVQIVTDRVNRGLRFISALRQHIADFKPDLVWINPLQAFIDGDVTDSKDLGSFLREGLNSLNHAPAFGYILVHHTTKPATGKDRSERLWHEVMYDMAGGAEIINWARAIISLRATAEEGNFNLVLAKRGRRAGVTKEVPQGTGFRLEPVTTIPLKHATGRLTVPGLKRGLPIIHWEPRTPDEPPESAEPTRRGGRPEKYPFTRYRNVFPKKNGPGAPYNEVYRSCEGNGHIPTGSFASVLDKWAEKGEIEIIMPESGQNRYRAAN